MKNIEIRKATIDDLEAIQELNNDLFKLEKANYDTTLVVDWPFTETGKSYFIDLIHNHYIIVAEDNNIIIGYLAGSINEKGSYTEVQYGEINNMLVKDEYRGYGVGKLLIKNFKEFCRTNNINNMKVMASYKNRNAIEFYHKNGFEEFEVTLTTKI